MAEAGAEAPGLRGLLARAKSRASPGMRKWWGALMGVMNTMDERNLGLIAAGTGFFAMLALFPGIAALIAVWGLVADPAMVQAQLVLVERLLPPAAYDIFDDQLTRLVLAGPGTLGWATVISTSLSLWWARSGVASLIRGLNAVYREEHRGPLRRILSSIAVTLALVGMLLVALVAIIVVPVVMAVLPLGPVTEWLVEISRWSVTALTLLVGLGIVYRYGPNRKAAKVPWLSPGALVALVIWAAASWAFSLYLSNFGRYNEVYGSLGAVVALLMWLYLSAYVTLLGATLNAELELRTLPDTTIGPDKPMGQRGAYVADTYIKP